MSLFEAAYRLQGPKRSNFPPHIFRFFHLFIDRGLSRRLLLGRMGKPAKYGYFEFCRRGFPFFHPLYTRSTFSSPRLDMRGTLDFRQHRILFGHEIIVRSRFQDGFSIDESHLCRASASCEGDGCMKETDHPIRHPSIHLRIFGRARQRRSCAWRDSQLGRGQNTGLGWSDPTFGPVTVPKVIRGSLQPVGATSARRVLSAWMWGREIPNAH